MIIYLDDSNKLKGSHIPIAKSILKNQRDYMHEKEDDAKNSKSSTISTKKEEELKKSI